MKFTFLIATIYSWQTAEVHGPLLLCIPLWQYQHTRGLEPQSHMCVRVGGRDDQLNSDSFDRYAVTYTARLPIPSVDVS